jgi:long-chain acyl-CoA synthetase
VFRLRVEGREHLPLDGPLLIAPNHVSDLDPVIVSAALPVAFRDRVRWAGDLQRLFGSKLKRILCRALGVFPVDVRRPALALDVAQAVLGRGGVQVWFSEAWRSPDGRLQKFRPGIGQLILRTRAPVVPLLLLGAFEAMPRTRTLPRLRPLRAIFGAPIDAESLIARAGSQANAEAVAEALRAEIIALARQAEALALLPPAAEAKSGGEP